MTSQAGQMPRSLMGSIGRFRCQWVKREEGLDLYVNTNMQTPQASLSDYKTIKENYINFNKK